MKGLLKKLRGLMYRPLLNYLEEQVRFYDACIAKSIEMSNAAGEKTYDNSTINDYTVRQSEVLLIRKHILKKMI